MQRRVSLKEFVGSNWAQSKAQGLKRWFQHGCHVLWVVVYLEFVEVMRIIKRLL